MWHKNQPKLDFVIKHLLWRYLEGWSVFRLLHIKVKQISNFETTQKLIHFADQKSVQNAFVTFLLQSSFFYCGEKKENILHSNWPNGVLTQRIYIQFLLNVIHLINVWKCLVQLIKKYFNQFDKKVCAKSRIQFCIQGQVITSLIISGSISSCFNLI